MRPQSPRSAPGHGKSRRILPLISAIAAVVLALSAWSWLRSWSGAHDEALALLRETGLDRCQPDLVELVRREPDPLRAKLTVARAIVADAFDPQGCARLSPREAMESASRLFERLDLARRIATETLRAQPATWQAAMILGGATYLEWSLRSDPRVVSARREWEAPLLAARELAPGAEEPLRFLAFAWLETWPSIPDAGRPRAREVFRGAFRDRETFGRLVELWLTVTENQDTAFDLVPDEPWYWRTLESVYARRSDWHGWCAAREREEHALKSELARRVDELEARLRGGDLVGARGVTLGVVADVPPDLAWRDGIERAIQLCPPGPTGPDHATYYRRWLEWALGAYIDGELVLARPTLERLIAGAGELPAAEEALARLAAGDLGGAELLERRSEALNTEPWAPYCIAKAGVLAARGELAGARAILARMNRAFGGSVAAIGAQRAISLAERSATGVAAADAELARLAATSWSATTWRWHGGVAQLEVLPSAAARGLEIALDVVSAGGGVVGVRVDARMVAVAPVSAGASVRVRAQLAATTHRVEFETLAGDRVVPGTVSLLADARP